MKHAGNMHAAQLELSKLEPISREVVDLILGLEKIINTVKGVASHE